MKENNFTDEEYDRMTGELFVRFPSFQKDGSTAYKPGLANMEFFDQLNGHPHRKFLTVHVAGTNGKGSVCSMLASVLASAGLKVGLYTSPHILDFRERMKIVEASGCGCGRESVTPRCVPKRYVWDFVRRWGETFDHLDLSFFEITTSMAFDWLASEDVDIAVIETGLGGRLDSTNIISPVLSVITNIGLDHCDMLGGTLSEIAFEKAGIIKPETPVVVGESDPETDPVFERKVLYSNLSSPEYMGDRTRIMSLLVFADKTSPEGWDDRDRILSGMDLKGEYQEKNLRTVLAAVEVLRKVLPGRRGLPAGRAARLKAFAGMQRQAVVQALECAAAATGFHGRWETVSENPWVICDIGHNAHGLKYNFHQLGKMLDEGVCSRLIMVYGSVADKDYSEVFPLFPMAASVIFTNAEGKRACPAGVLADKYRLYCRDAGRQPGEVEVCGRVTEAVERALKICSVSGSDAGDRPLIYIGGSTYVVAEAVACLKSLSMK